MAFLLLANTIGQAKTGISTSGGAISSGYKAAYAITGPRSRLVRADAATSHTFSYTCPSTTVSHFILAGAYWFANGQNAGNLELETAGGNYSSTAAASMSLVGKYSRDWVSEIAATSTSYSVVFNHSPASATLYSKCYFSNAFDFGDPPQLVSIRNEEESFRPWLGYQSYNTEAVIKLIWQNISSAIMNQFDALPLCWPFFLYDENADLFNHKLEHVIIAEPFTKTRRIDGSYNLELTVRRLKHYE